MQLTELITRHLNVPEARERSTISISFGVSSQIINIQEIHLCSIIHIQLLPKLHKGKKKKNSLQQKSMHVFALQSKLYLFSLLGTLCDSIQDLWAWVMVIEVFQ